MNSTRLTSGETAPLAQPHCAELRSRKAGAKADKQNKQVGPGPQLSPRQGLAHQHTGGTQGGTAGTEVSSVRQAAIQTLPQLLSDHRQETACLRNLGFLWEGRRRLFLTGLLRGWKNRWTVPQIAGAQQTGLYSSKEPRKRTKAFSPTYCQVSSSSPCSSRSC